MRWTASRPTCSLCVTGTRRYLGLCHASTQQRDISSIRDIQRISYGHAYRRREFGAQSTTSGRLSYSYRSASRRYPECGRRAGRWRELSANHRRAANPSIKIRRADAISLAISSCTERSIVLLGMQAEISASARNGPLAPRPAESYRSQASVKRSYNAWHHCIVWREHADGQDHQPYLRTF
ncbi:hypothetical protein OH77DRAFT_279802 [Trametes cingulata]|nr:hypothetical protein OH77DRAFT_279802 [Trametes cingulata]